MAGGGGGRGLFVVREQVRSLRGVSVEGVWKWGLWFSQPAQIPTGEGGGAEFCLTTQHLLGGGGLGGV